MSSTTNRPADAAAHVEEVLPAVREHLDRLLAAHASRHARLSGTLGTLLDHGRPEPYEARLPLLVHAAVTGDPRPAVPVAATHTLWWRAANALDDVTDGEPGTALYGTRRGAAMTAALVCGYDLPLRALDGPQVPSALHRALARDLLEGWAAAVDGQIADLLDTPESVTPGTVLDTYRRKSGAAYAMACAMAARLALAGPDDGAHEGFPGAKADGRREAVDGWHRFGQVLGVLAQFRNDHDDLRDGPGDDLRNGTATYLLAQLLHTASRTCRRRARALLDRAPGEGAAREELAALMLDPEVLRPYRKLIDELRGQAHDLLDELVSPSTFAEALRDCVDSAAERSVPAPRVTVPGGRNRPVDD